MEEMENMPSLEGAYLGELVRKARPVRVVLKNGYRIICVIEDFDDNVLILRTKNERQMQYRHNISTVVLEQLMPHEKTGGGND